jgi:hypothetical protein
MPFKFNSKKVGYTCSWMSILAHLAPFVDATVKVRGLLVAHHFLLVLTCHCLGRVLQGARWACSVPSTIVRFSHSHLFRVYSPEAIHDVQRSNEGQRSQQRDPYAATGHTSAHAGRSVNMQADNRRVGSLLKSPTELTISFLFFTQSRPPYQPHNKPFLLPVQSSHRLHNPGE